MRLFVDRALPRAIAPRSGSVKSSVACGRNRSASITGGIVVFFDRRASMRCIISRATRCVFSSPVAADDRALAAAAACTSRSRSGGTAFASDAPSAARFSADPRASDGARRGEDSAEASGDGEVARGDGEVARGAPSRLPSATPAPPAMSAANARPPADGPPIAASRRAAPSRAPQTCAEHADFSRRRPARMRARRRRTIQSPVPRDGVPTPRRTRARITRVPPPAGAPEPTIDSEAAPPSPNDDTSP